MNKKKAGVNFNIPNRGKKGKKRVKERWRKPRGIDNKKRIRKKAHGKSPKIGYKNQKELRYLHPSYKKEALIRNEKEIENYDPNEYALRIASSVGKRKRALIVKIANEKGFKVLNAGNLLNQKVG
jgi:large subunit ribosomal protein L32e